MVGETIKLLCKVIKGEDYDEIPREDDTRNGKSIFEDTGMSSSCG